MLGPWQLLRVSFFGCTLRHVAWRRKLPSPPLILPGKFHRQRRLAGYNPWVAKSWTWLSTRHVELPRPGFEPAPPALEARSLNLCTTREALWVLAFDYNMVLHLPNIREALLRGLAPFGALGTWQGVRQTESCPHGVDKYSKHKVCQMVTCYRGQSCGQGRGSMEGLAYTPGAAQGSLWKLEHLSRLDSTSMAILVVKTIVKIEMYLLQQVNSH